MAKSGVPAAHELSREYRTHRQVRRDDGARGPSAP